MIFTAGQLRKAGADIPARIPDESEISAHTLSPVKYRPRKRDLTKAVTLRPKDVFDLYGIPPSTLCRLTTHADPAKRIPSVLIPGRQGRRGIRLYDHAKLRAFLEAHAQ